MTSTLMKICGLVYLALQRKRWDELGSDFVAAKDEIKEDWGELCGEDKASPTDQMPCPMAVAFSFMMLWLQMIDMKKPWLWDTYQFKVAFLNTFATLVEWRLFTRKLAFFWIQSECVPWHNEAREDSLRAFGCMMTKRTGLCRIELVNTVLELRTGGAHPSQGWIIVAQPAIGMWPSSYQWKDS